MVAQPAGLNRPVVHHATTPVMLALIAARELALSLPTNDAAFADKWSGFCRQMETMLNDAPLCCALVAQRIQLGQGLLPPRSPCTTRASWSFVPA